MVSFLTYLCSYLLGKKYVALSNEASANESNVDGENINHQYSKTIEYENDFREYAEKYLKGNVEYFSLLRPISELQIAKLFSELEDYHKIFKSCNVGSKSNPWKWCCNCPKCLFVYTILSPFLYKEKLVNIFEEDLFVREDLLKTFIELCGYGEIKPFECVGTFSEIRYSVSQVIKRLENENLKLPYLLKYYKEFINEYGDYLCKACDENHNVPCTICGKGEFKDYSSLHYHFDCWEKELGEALDTWNEHPVECWMCGNTDCHPFSDTDNMYICDECEANWNQIDQVNE